MSDQDLFVLDPTRPHLGGNLKVPDQSSLWPDLVKWMAENLEMAILRILDVGCGTGETMHLFQKHNWEKCIGIEGLQENAVRCHFPVLVHDLTKGPAPFTGIDLVWCVEVVEHIEERYLEYLLKTITCGRWLAMTHALPGQGGYHHVNCRPTEWWVRQMFRYNMELDLDKTNFSRTLVPKNSFWYNSGLIFKKVK